MSHRGMPKTQSIRDGLRKAAQERQAENDKLTVQQKLARLPEKGCERQRARYLAAIEKAKTAPVVVAIKADDAKEKRAVKEEQKQLKKENKQ